MLLLLLYAEKEKEKEVDGDGGQGDHGLHAVMVQYSLSNIPADVLTGSLYISGRKRGATRPS